MNNILWPSQDFFLLKLYVKIYKHPSTILDYLILRSKNNKEV